MAQFPGLGRNQPHLEAAVQFVASACMGLLLWWLDNDVPYSAEELYAIFRRLTTQACGASSPPPKGSGRCRLLDDHGLWTA
jgi:hypothetical protein